MSAFLTLHHQIEFGNQYPKNRTRTTSPMSFTPHSEHPGIFTMKFRISHTKATQGRSINLILSERGISALRLVGITDEVIKRNSTPVKGKMVHTEDGRGISFLTDGKGRSVLYSVLRKDLNEVLLTVAEKNPNVKFFYKHKLLSCCFKTGKFKVQRHDGKIIEESTDLLIGCDGAYSAVRRQMVQMLRFDYHQSYFEHGYIELCFPSTESGQFAIEADYFHFWSRKQVMLTALPNPNCTFTITLFMPFELFEQINTPEKLLQLFSENFPDAIPLIGKEKLVTDFFNASPNALVSIKVSSPPFVLSFISTFQNLRLTNFLSTLRFSQCSSYHVEDKALILGDAAHAMLPFGGQGVNAGLEDCEILSELLNVYKCDFRKVLSEFTKCRQKDAEIICDFAQSTYHVVSVIIMSGL
ncbi:kynurenine 3-monooxygenase [Nephila pilipes]|uniref:Kynurenine 3-monooxygenase n=1 Tax=Nephila pilipes TaxID=299642 RepID=A0A8X6T4T5_NEPPI|nr:kynurenine 3-monooxygenase [Nephila pilipes]